MHVLPLSTSFCSYNVPVTNVFDLRFIYCVTLFSQYSWYCWVCFPLFHFIQAGAGVVLSVHYKNLCESSIKTPILTHPFFISPIIIGHEICFSNLLLLEVTLFAPFRLSRSLIEHIITFSTCKIFSSSFLHHLLLLVVVVIFVCDRQLCLTCKLPQTLKRPLQLAPSFFKYQYQFFTSPEPLTPSTSRHQTAQGTSWSWKTESPFSPPPWHVSSLLEIPPPFPPPRKNQKSNSKSTSLV